MKNIKNIALLFTVFGYSFSLLSQTIIRGNVKGFYGENIKNATVYLENSFYETNTDEEGNYTLKIPKNYSKGIHLVVQKIGYSDLFKEYILQNDDREITVNFIFEFEALEEVVITSHKNISKIEPITTKSVSFMEVLGTSTDVNIITSLNSISGAQKVGESGELSVRGGEGYETNYLFDGMILRNQLEVSSTNQGSRLRFSPLLFKNFNFYAGGYSAEYGQALSSILVLESEDILTEKSLNIVTSPFFIDATSNFPIKKDQSIELNVVAQDFGIYTHMLEPDLAFQDLLKGPKTLSGSMFYKKNLNDKGFLKLFSYGSTAKIISSIDNIDNSSIDEQSTIDNKYTYNLATYNYELSKKNKIKIGFSYAHNFDKLKTDTINNLSTIFGKTLSREMRDIHFKSKLTSKLSSTLMLNSGIEFFNQTENYTSDVNTKRIDDNLYALYSEGTYRIFKNIYTTVGARFEYSSILKRASLAPRLNLLYVNNNIKLSCSFGEFYQQADLYTIKDSYKPNFLKATHYIVSGEKLFKNHILKIDLYNKVYNRLMRKDRQITNTNGSGNAKGFDILFKGKEIFSKYDYQITYSFIDSNRLYMDYPINAPVSFASKHNASLSVSGSFFDDLFVSVLKYSYNSGRPYYNPNKSSNRFHEDITNDFHDLSTSMFYTIKVKGKSMFLMASISNILGNEQTYGYEYSKNDFSIRRPIRSLYNRFFFVGAYISLGLDNSKKYIDKLINN